MRKIKKKENMIVLELSKSLISKVIKSGDSTRGGV